MFQLCCSICQLFESLYWLSMVCCLGSLWEGLSLQGQIINVNVFLFYRLCKTLNPQASLLGVIMEEFAMVSIFPGKISFLFLFILVPLSFLFQSCFFLFPLYHALPEKETHSGKWGYGQRGKICARFVPFGRFYVIKVIKSYCCKGQGEKFNISSQVLSVHVKALFTLRFYPLELSLGLSIETSMCACVFQSITVHFGLFAACPSSGSVG